MGRLRTDNKGVLNDDYAYGSEHQSRDLYIEYAKEANMIRITDKAFRYTPSFNTDLRKKFRKMEQERRAAEASRVSAGTMSQSVVPMVARRSAQNP